MGGRSQAIHRQRLLDKAEQKRAKASRPLPARARAEGGRQGRPPPAAPIRRRRRLKAGSLLFAPFSFVAGRFPGGLLPPTPQASRGKPAKPKASRQAKRKRQAAPPPAAPLALVMDESGQLSDPASPVRPLETELRRLAASPQLSPRPRIQEVRGSLTEETAGVLPFKTKTVQVVTRLRPVSSGQVAVEIHLNTTLVAAPSAADGDRHQMVIGSELSSTNCQPLVAFRPAQLDHPPGLSGVDVPTSAARRLIRRWFLPTSRRSFSEGRAPTTRT